MNKMIAEKHHEELQNKFKVIERRGEFMTIKEFGMFMLALGAFVLFFLFLNLVYSIFSWGN